MSQRDFPPIEESAEALQDMLAHEHSAKRRTRLHLLFLIRSGQVKTREQAAKHLVTHRNSIQNWLNAYKSGGLKQLLHIGTTGPKPEQKSLSVPAYEALQEQIRGDGFSGYTDAREWLQREHGVDLPYSTVHKIIRYRLKAKLKRARPRHQKNLAWQR
jgi:transposase